MIRANLSLHRRTRTERRVIALLRGEDSEAGLLEAGRYFARLRTWSRKSGLVILPPGTPYISTDELSIMAWLARAQRLLPLGSCAPNRCISAVVRRCAVILADNDLRLSSLTFCSKL